MKGKSWDRFVGKYCKIVTKEPGEEKIRISIGSVTDIDHDTGFIIVESDEGFMFLKIESVVAIKPRRKFGFILDY
jgi:ribosome maturation factor RimP